MNDVECVRCSACVVHCPMDVLYFGNLPRVDTQNQCYQTHADQLPQFDKSRWEQGLQ